MHVHPRAEKKIEGGGQIYRGKSPGRECIPGRGRVQFLGNWGDLEVLVVNLVLLVVNFFEQEK